MAKISDIDYEKRKRERDKEGRKQRKIYGYIVYIFLCGKLSLI